MYPVKTKEDEGCREVSKPLSDPWGSVKGLGSVGVKGGKTEDTRSVEDSEECTPGSRSV